MELVNRFDEGSAIAIIPKIDEDISLKAPIVSVQLYHIAQEALTNAVKYSRAETIEITLRKESSELVLSVLDNGTGFECGKTDGLGLLIMQYRANVAGGRLSIVSEREKARASSVGTSRSLLAKIA
jgi:signal transduction histidine kinase